MKFTMTYSRKVATEQYESVQISLTQEFDENSKWDESLKEMQRFIDDKIIEKQRELTRR